MRNLSSLYIPFELILHQVYSFFNTTDISGTDKGMSETFGSTCHGAGRALSRNQSRKTLDHKEVLNKLKENGIAIRVATPKLVTEEAPESYKDVCEVIETCQDAGISQKVVRLRPIAVIKG